MSHSTCFVIVPTDKSLRVMNAKAEEILAPFSEELQVEPYLTDCYCVGNIACAAAREEAEKVHGTIDDLRHAFHEEHPVPDFDDPQFEIKDKANDVAWKSFIAPYVKTQDDAEKAHPMYQKADPACEDCKGTGKRETTYNPKSKWDWYELGGRWHGIFEGKNCVSTTYWVDASITEIDKKAKPFACLEPDGTWHEKGHMGWWGMTWNEKETIDWDTEFLALMGKYAIGYSVLCYDLHI